MTVKVKNSKTKAHIQYRNKDKVRVPGVTTILNILNKPALIYWSWNLGMQRIDYRKYRDKMADIGTLTHLMILEHLSSKEQDYSEYSKAEIEKAENCMLSFFEWEKTNKIKPILLETPLVSELHSYGGTIDCYCQLNDVPTLIDFKTGKAIYDEMMYQVSAYKQLLVEHKKPVEQVKILRVGRDEDEGFEDRLCKNMDLNWNVFSYCLNIYQTVKKIKDDSDDFYNWTKKVSDKK